MSNQKLIPTSKSLPCAVCGDTSGKCRNGTQDPDYWLCSGFPDLRKFETVNGFKFLKTSSCGFWGVFKPDSASEDWRELKPRREPERRQKAKEKEELQALSPDERHKHYSAILDSLSLDATTVTDLRRRGFSDEQIKASGFKSVGKYQKLNKKFPLSLSGIGHSGDYLATSGSGYLCPVCDFLGRIVALQLRLHRSDGGRYRWLSTPKTAELRTGRELPLAVHKPDGEPVGVALCEGTGAKPFLLSQKLNFLTIGASGGNHLSSQKILKSTIEQALEEYGNIPLTIFPDAGFGTNKHVRKKIIELSKWLQDNFQSQEVKIADWNQLIKNQGDIDELKPEEIQYIRYLEPESFFKKYSEVFLQNKQGKLSNRFENWAKNRVKLTADKIQQEKWLNLPSGVEKDCDILLIRKNLGGGKTEAIIDFLKQKDAASLLIGYRNSLSYNTINRSNQKGLKASHIKDCKEKIGGQIVNFANDSSIKLWGGCADSYFKFDAIIDRNPNYFTVFDEICSVLNHLKGGGTLKGRQKAAIDWTVETIKNSSFSIMADANLSDKQVDFIRQLFPEKRIKVLDSIGEIPPKNFYFLETKDSEEDYSKQSKFLSSQLLEKAKNYSKILWISDSQTSCEIADTVLSKHGHKHYRLDGKTSHDELAKQLQSDPKQFILSEKLDSLSLSPSAESGLSIDLYRYFDAVLFDSKGSVDVDTLVQISGRLRDSEVPIFVSCPEFTNLDENLCPYAIQEVEKVLSQRIEMLLGKALEAEPELVDNEFVINTFSQMGVDFSSDPWFLESLKDAKNLKYERSNLKLCLKTALSQAGHRIFDLPEESSPQSQEERQEAKEKVKDRESFKVYNSDNIDWETAQELSRKDCDYDTKCKIRKARLKHRLPGIEASESWGANFIRTVLLDHQKFLEQRWRLKQLEDPELLNACFKVSKRYNFEKGFQAKDCWKDSFSKVEALKQLGVGQLIEKGIFSAQDPEVQKIVNLYYSDQGYYEILGFSKAKKTNTSQYLKTMLDRFFGFLGLEVKLFKRTKNKRTYHLKVNKDLQPYIKDIDSSLKVRAEQILEDSKEISLTRSAEKFEAELKTEEKWKEQQAELNRQVLEVSLTHTHSDLVTPSPTIYINKSQRCHQYTDRQVINSTLYTENPVNTE